MAKSILFLPSLHNIQMPNVRWSIVLLWIFLITLVHSHTIHKRQNIFESAASIDKASLSVSNETVAAISSENEPPTIFDENDGGGIEDVNEEVVQSRTKNADIQNVNEVNNINNERVKVSSTTDINNVIEQSFGARNNDTNARAATVTIDTPAGSSSSSSTSNAPTNFTKDFSLNESVENRYVFNWADQFSIAVNTKND